MRCCDGRKTPPRVILPVCLSDVWSAKLVSFYSHTHPQADMVQLSHHLLKEQYFLQQVSTSVTPRVDHTTHPGTRTHGAEGTGQRAEHVLLGSFALCICCRWGTGQGSASEGTALTRQPAVTCGGHSPLGKILLHRKSRGPPEAPTHGSEQRTKQFRAVCSVSKFAQAFTYLCKNRLSPGEELSPFYLLRDRGSTAQGSPILPLQLPHNLHAWRFFSNRDHQLYNENWLRGSRQLRLI